MALRFGTDSSNYYSSGNITTNSEGNAFTNGWNLISTLWVNATTTGTPTNTDIAYVRVTYNTTATANTGVKLNQIISRLGEIVEVLYYSKYMFRDASTGAFQETVTADTNLINLDTESFNLLLNLTALYCVQQVFDGSSSFDIQFYTEEYTRALARYQGLYKSQRNKPRVQYYRKSNTGFRRFFGRGANY